MSEWTNNAVQAIAPGATVVFTENPVPCRSQLVWAREGTGLFGLKGFVPPRRVLPGQPLPNAIYQVTFGANIAVPTGQTAGQISLAIAIDGVAIPASSMIATPADVGEYANVCRAINAQIRNGCCGTLSIINTSSIPILVQNANVIFTRPDLR